MSENVKKAVKSAVDWLRANPDHHITGQLAVDERGNMRLPTDADACGFCALGRISKELNLKTYPSEGSREFLDVLVDKAVDEDQIFRLNDIDVNSRKRSVCGRLGRGNDEVLDYLEKIFDLK